MCGELLRDEPTNSTGTVGGEELGPLNRYGAGMECADHGSGI